jgi:hypothetical protein
MVEQRDAGDVPDRGGEAVNDRSPPAFAHVRNAQD